VIGRQSNIAAAAARSFMAKSIGALVVK